MIGQNICLVLLAAGSGKRFGPDGKLHQQLSQNKSLLQASAQLYATAAVQHRLMVIRSADERAKHVARAHGYRVVENSAAESGMASSLRHGIDAAKSTGADWLMVALADMPYVTPDSLSQLCSHAGRGAALIQPSHRGQAGHPVLWHRRLWPDLMRVSGDTGGRAVVQHHADQRLLVPVDDAGIHADIDRPTDIRP